MKIADLSQQAEEYLAEDKYEEAIVLYEQIIETAPKVKYNYWRLGLALLLKGLEEEAQTCWIATVFELFSEEIEESTKELISFLEIEGTKRLEIGQYPQAEKIYFQLVEQDPTNAIYYKNLGNALYNQGKLQEAISFYQQGIALEPNDSITHYHLGNAFHQLEKLEQAILHYQQSLTIDPNSANVMNNLGNALQRQGKLVEAIACYQQSLNLEPNDALTYNNLGSAFYTQGNLEEALAYFQKSLILEPNNLESYNNLARFYQDCRLYEEAISYCERAIEIDSDYANARWNLSLLLLRLGNFQRGFEEYEWRWRCEQSPPRPLPKPVWDGAKLDGKTILLQAEQGIGDLIQFIRYVPLVIERGGRIIVECHPPLVRLIKSFKGVEKVIAIGETLPDFDFYIPLLSLPRILGTTLETIPAEIPYIYPLESVNFNLDTPAKACPKVGLVWAGNPSHQNDRNRSCSLNHFLHLLNIPNIAFYSLQKGPKAAEIERISKPLLLQDLSDRLNDFADTAAVIAQLDLIITVDTSVAHLAGAMAKPVWVLLCYNADWRWLTERDDSPWYPTMRLFRQNSPGDWQKLIARVEEALTQLYDRCVDDTKNNQG